MATTRDYTDYLNDQVDIAPVNSQEELQAAQVIEGLFAQHGLETQVEEFDAPLMASLSKNLYYIILFVGILLAGFIGTPVGTFGFVLTLISFALIALEHNGTDMLADIGPRARSQNVIGVHRATGPNVVKGNRPIVIVAHIDTPRENFLYKGNFAKWQPIIRRISWELAIAVLVLGLIQVLPFISPMMRHLFWVIGVLIALPLLMVGASAIYERFAPCTTGANDNKAALAAMLGVLDQVRPGPDEAKEWAATHPKGIRRSREEALEQDIYGDEWAEGEEAPEEEAFGNAEVGTTQDDEQLLVEGLGYVESDAATLDEFGDEGEYSAEEQYVAEDEQSDFKRRYMRAQRTRGSYVDEYGLESPATVRRGAALLESLQVLPEDCEIEYENLMPREEAIERIGELDQEEYVESDYFDAEPGLQGAVDEQPEADLGALGDARDGAQRVFGRIANFFSGIGERFGKKPHLPEIDKAEKTYTSDAIYSEEQDRAAYEEQSFEQATAEEPYGAEAFSSDQVVAPMPLIEFETQEPVVDPTLESIPIIEPVEDTLVKEVETTSVDADNYEQDDDLTAGSTAVFPAQPAAEAIATETVPEAAVEEPVDDVLGVAVADGVAAPDVIVPSVVVPEIETLDEQQAAEGTEIEPEIAVAAELEPVAVAEPEPIAEPQPEAEPMAEAWLEPEVAVEAAAETAAEVAPEPEAVATATPEPDAAADATLEPGIETIVEPELESVVNPEFELVDDAAEGALAVDELPIADIELIEEDEEPVEEFVAPEIEIEEATTDDSAVVAADEIAPEEVPLDEAAPIEAAQEVAPADEVAPIEAAQEVASADEAEAPAEEEPLDAEALYNEGIIDVGDEPGDDGELESEHTPVEVTLVEDSGPLVSPEDMEDLPFTKQDVVDAEFELIDGDDDDDTGSDRIEVELVDPAEVEAGVVAEEPAAEELYEDDIDIDAVLDEPDGVIPGIDDGQQTQPTSPAQTAPLDMSEDTGRIGEPLSTADSDGAIPAPFAIDTEAKPEPAQPEPSQPEPAQPEPTPVPAPMSSQDRSSILHSMFATRPIARDDDLFEADDATLGDTQSSGWSVVKADGEATADEKEPEAKEPEVKKADDKKAEDKQAEDKQAPALDADKTQFMSGLTFSSERDVSEEELAQKDVTGLSMVSAEAEADAEAAMPPVEEHIPKPRAIDDPNWGKSTFRPSAIAAGRRATLLDLPDPSVIASDPFDARHPGGAVPTVNTTPMPNVPNPADMGTTQPSNRLDILGNVPSPRDEARPELEPVREEEPPAPPRATSRGAQEPVAPARSRSDRREKQARAAKKASKRKTRFGRNRKEEPQVESMGEWLGLEDDYDAKKNGRQIGTWDNFGDDGDRGKWKGGAAMRAGLREVGGDEDKLSLPSFGTIMEDADAELADEAPLTEPQAEEAAFEEALPAEAEAPDYENIDFDDVPMDDVPLDEPAEPVVEVDENTLRFGDDDIIAHDVWFVGTGASSLGHAGIKAFLEEHRKDLRGAFLVNLESIGAGDLRVLATEGTGTRRKADRRLLRMLCGIANAMNIDIDRADYSWNETDATPPMQRSVRVSTLMGMNADGLPAHSHTNEDEPEYLDDQQIANVAQIVADLIRQS